MPGTALDTLNQLKNEAFSGALGQASAETLNRYAAALCDSRASGEFGGLQFPQICETVRIHLLRAHIELLQTHITDLDAKNTRLTKWVIALAVAALISTLFQTIGTGIQTKIAIETLQLMKSPPQSSAQQPPQSATPAPAATSAQSYSNPPPASAAKHP